MSHVIAEPCVGVKDKACVPACPVDCIKGEETDDQLYIDPAECIDCGACIEPCPVQAIFTEEDLPEKWKSFTQKNADYFKKK